MASLQRKIALRRGNTLIEILVVLAILTVLGGISYQFYAGKTKPGEKGKTPMEAGKGAACKMQIDQARLGITNYKLSDDNEKPPPTLAELKLPKEALICPDSKKPFVYSAETGELHCETPGHEKN